NVCCDAETETCEDLLYVMDRGGAIGEESAAEIVGENKLMEKTKAYKEGNIIYLDPEYWYLSGGGLQSVSKMVEEVDESLEVEKYEVHHLKFVFFICSDIL